MSQEDLLHECGHSKDGRNLVVCIDGTSNQFGDKNTNVIELYSLILKEIRHRQRTWYNSGIGTYARPSWKSPSYYKQVIYHKVDLAIAWNFERTVQGAYQWLSDNYEEGDCIFLFGFSRGAFQVRVLAGMIDKVGLIHKGNEMQIPFAYEIYKDEKTDLPTTNPEGSNGQAQMSKAERFKDTFSHKDVKVHFVGAWDTVSSIGIVRGKRMLPRTVDGMKHVCYFRHALALDERRVKFLPEYAYGGDTVERQPPSMTGKQSDEHLPTSGTLTPDSSHRTLTNIYPHTKEVWFAGTHSDIGGGNVTNLSLDRGRPPLRWMASEAAAVGLRLAPFDRELSFKEQIEVMESLTWAWWPLEYLPMKRLTFSDDENNKDTTHEPHFGRSRQIKRGQKIHSSVLLADADVKYTPKAMPPAGINNLVFWHTLRDGAEAFEEWVEADENQFMRELVKTALAGQNNPALEGLLLPATTRGPQGLYNAVIEALNNQELLHDQRLKAQLLTTVMSIVEKTPTNNLVLVPSANVLPALQDLYSSDCQENRSVVKAFIDQCTDASLLVIREQYPVWSVAFSPDGRWIASTSYNSLATEPQRHVIRIWEAKSGKLARQPLEGHTNFVTCVDFSPNGRYLASGSVDTTIRVWDLATEPPTSIVLEGHQATIRKVTFSPDGKYLASGSNDTRIGIWDMTIPKPQPTMLKGHKGPVNSVVVSPNSRRIASCSDDGRFCLWNVERGFDSKIIQYGVPIWSVAFSSDGQRAMLGLADGGMVVWDVDRHREVMRVAKPHEGPVCSIQYSPDGAYIASASEDRTVRIWDAARVEQARSPLKGHKDVFLCMAYSPDGKYIVTGGRGCTTRVWNATVGEDVNDVGSLG